MHGRPRKPQKPEEEEASAAEAAKLRPLQSQLLENHHQKNYDKEALEVSAKLLEMNPDLYTAWNYRKLAVEHYLKESPSDIESIKAILNEELRVAESALRQNFKSYGAWYHRKWILSKGHSSTDHELRLLGKFQKLDARNFHAWNYRRFVAALMNIPEEKELKYTTDMIDTNFSNYSAWHNRSALLSKLLNKKAEVYLPVEKVLNEEYELVHQAIFTDPDDQSGWFYHLWLLDQTVKTNSPSLVSSWPPYSYKVELSRTGRLDDRTLSPSSSSHSDSGTLPLILYFDQPVQGVDSSSVNVKSTANLRGDLTWKPLSKCNCDAAKTWVSHLIFHQEELNSSESYSVEVSLGHSQKITSASGFHHVKPTCFSFKVNVHLGETPIEDCGNEGICWWKDENFTSCGIIPQNFPFVSSDNLTIEDNYAPSNSEWCAEIISNEIALFRELLSETDCKIGKLTLARLLMAHAAVSSPHANKMVQFEEVLELYQDLMKLDPSHFHYYKDEHSLVLLQKVTSTTESLLRHCYCYKDQASPYIGGTTCLRLNSLSISRIGSVEKLLWVQVLDLSHNELRSIEGLEAMQLLSCLSLSYNKISSFTALEPLRLLKSLKLLDISYNEIGSHSIDTTRYLFSSPLSHSEENDLSGDKMVTDCPDLASYWEAYFLFKALSLTQLDIEGNLISSERFKAFLVKVLPKLHWLDGKQVQ